jgi:hypothetical protein
MLPAVTSRDRNTRSGSSGRAERAPADPAIAGRADYGGHAEHQPGRDQHRTQGVGPGAQPDAVGLVRLDHPGGGHRGHDPDRDVDEEDPVPVNGLSDEAARQHADRGARRAGEAVPADGPRPQRGLGEHRDHHSEHHGRGHGPADALHEPRDNQHLLAGGQAAAQRGHGEHGQPGDEHPPAADQVTEAPGQQQQAAERDQVRVDHPGQARL